MKCNTDNELAFLGAGCDDKNLVHLASFNGINIFVYSMNPFLSLSVRPSIHPSVLPFVSLFFLIRLFTSSLFRLSIGLYFRPPVLRFVCVFINVCLSVYLFNI